MVMTQFNGFSLDPVQVPKVDSKYRQIQTALPVPESVPLLKDMYAYESKAMHGQLPIVWDRAKDFQVWDSWGNCWIDFTSTIFVANAGHSNSKIVAALKKQLEKPLLHTYNYANAERISYLKYLIENTPPQFEKAFLLSAGTEAVEAALKLMRLKGQQLESGKIGVIGLQGNWHGRTMGAQFLAGNEGQKTWIGHQDPHIFHMPFPYEGDPEVEGEKSAVFFTEKIEGLMRDNKLDPSKDICGFMLETFQGWGAWFYPKPFMQALEAYAKAHNILICFDEMQAGFGRTGSLFGYMHYGIEPDLLCLGKGASSGLPLSVVLGPADIMDIPDIGSMSSTHSANPLVCAAGLANLKALIEDKLIENSRELGDLFQSLLADIKSEFPEIISRINGKGLLAALIFTDKNNAPLSKMATAIAVKCLYSGLLTVHTGRESIKLAPPLSISEEALRDGVSVLRENIGIVYREMNGK
jgi:4-aminobutyrate aminotransferase / (S)-3-amino-2-methylpropionate transaminase / 5-aminovalerate transaminase